MAREQTYDDPHRCESFLCQRKSSVSEAAPTYGISWNRGQEGHYPAWLGPGGLGKYEGWNGVEDVEIYNVEKGGKGGGISFRSFFGWCFLAVAVTAEKSPP